MPTNVSTLRTKGNLAQLHGMAGHSALATESGRGTVAWGAGQAHALLFQQRQPRPAVTLPRLAWLRFAFDEGGSHGRTRLVHPITITHTRRRGGAADPRLEDARPLL